jgi:hypothetical protein
MLVQTKCAVSVPYNEFSTVKPTRCTNVSNLFWNDAIHVSDGLSVHHQEFKTVHTATDICQTDTAVCLLAGTRRNIGASSWFYYRNNITMRGPMNVRPTLNITNTTSLRFCEMKVSLVYMILQVWVVINL